MDDQLSVVSCRLSASAACYPWSCRRIGRPNSSTLTFEFLRDLSRSPRPCFAVLPFCSPTPGVVDDDWNQYEVGYTYGLYGTPTALELAGRICELEHGYSNHSGAGRTGAISLINFAFLKAGDHILVPESIYGPNRKFAGLVLRRFGVEVTFYPPTDGSRSPRNRCFARIRGWCGARARGRSPWKCRTCRRSPRRRIAPGALVVLDNTWSAGVYFDAFAHGVDVTMQALTKYVGGHSDLLLGSITVRDQALYERLGQHATTGGLRGFAGRLQPGAARHEDAGGAAEGD